MTMMKSCDRHPSLRDAPKEQTLCFTGHRPEKLPKDEKLILLTETLHLHIDEAVRKGYRYFITGLADGVDYMAAEYVIQLRETYPDIRLIGVQPCEDYEAFFRKRHYNSAHLQIMKSKADILIILPGKASDKDIFLMRNKFMVNHASALIAVCSASGKHSGSVQTLNYAKKSGLAICQIASNPELLYTPAPEQWPVMKSGF